MSAILKYFSPSLYASHTMERSPPNNLEEAAHQSVALETRFKTNHPGLYTVTACIRQLNNGVVALFENEHVQVIETIALKALLPATMLYFTPGSVLYKVICSVATTILCSYAWSSLKTEFLKPRLCLLGKYDSELGHLMQETQALPGAHLMALVDTSLASSGMKKTFIDRLIVDVSASIAERPLSKRFIYEITWQKEVTGYLIGTLHQANWAMVSDPFLHETVKKCGRLFVESHPKAIQCIACIRQWTSGSAIRYMVDAQLVETAVQNHISVEGLEPWDWHKQLASKCHEEQLLTTDNPKILAFCKHPPQHRSFEFLDAYQRGDSQAVALITQCLSPESYNVLLTQRNHTWLKGSPNLISRLRQEPTSESDRVMVYNPATRETSARSHQQTKPICIAVGVGHCLDKNGLVLQLRKEGFTVTKKETGV